MGRQKDTEFTGTIENIIFYERDGDFLMRTVQKQAATSQKAAKNYGRASNKAKVLRQLLLPLIPNPRDRNMQNRLTPAMREFLALLTARQVIQPTENPLAGFRFEVTSDFKDCLRFSIGFSRQPDGDILIEIPAIAPLQSIAAPSGTTRVELALMAVGFQMNEDETFGGAPELITIPYTDEMQPAIDCVLEVPELAGYIIVVAAALSYWNQDRQINASGFMPVQIAAVFKQ